MKKSFWQPAIPSGSIICDPCLYVVPESIPPILFIDLEVCRKLYGKFASEIFWSIEEVTLPPIHIRTIIDWMNALHIEPFPKQMRQYYRCIKYYNNKPVILQRLPEFHTGVGWFKAVEAAEITEN